MVEQQVWAIHGQALSTSQRLTSNRYFDCVGVDSEHSGQSCLIAKLPPLDNIWDIVGQSREIAGTNV